MTNQTSRKESLPQYLNDLQTRLRRTERRPGAASNPAQAYATVPTVALLPATATTPLGVKLLVIATGELATNTSGGWVLGMAPLPGSDGNIASGIADRRLIDNGQFAVNQRERASQVMGADGLYCADRWRSGNSGYGATTQAWTTAAAFGVPLPQGRPQPAAIQYILVNTAKTTPAAADYVLMYQSVEGVNMQHLNFGRADAQPLWAMFDVYSSVAGRYVVELSNIGTTAPTIRAFSRVFTVKVGWNTIGLMFPPDTVQGFINDYAARFQLMFWVAAGSNYTSGSLSGSWVMRTNPFRAAGLTNNIMQTVNNIFAVTNVDIRTGPPSTRYEVKSFGDELRACQRYAFYPGYMANPPANYVYLGSGFGVGSAQALTQMQLPVSMIGRPLLDMNGSTPGQYAVFDRAGGQVAVTNVQNDSVYANNSAGTIWTVAAGLTVARAYHVAKVAGQTAAFGWTCDI